MEYAWLKYEGVSEHELQGYLIRHQYEVEVEEPGELLLYRAGKGINPEGLKEYIWGLNGGLFCEVEAANYDEIEHLL